MKRLTAWWRPLSGQTKGIVVIVALVLLVAVGTSGSRSSPTAGVVVASPSSEPSAAAVVASPTELPVTSAPTEAPVATPEPTPIPTAAPTAKPTAAPTAKPVTYAALTNRTWAQVVKAPDNYVGEHYKLWGCISQFDAATGADSFRAQASYRNEDLWFIEGENALFNGDEDQLAEFVADDIVFMNVTVVGSFTYETQAGGSTTVPLFLVDVISQRGSC